MTSEKKSFIQIKNLITERCGLYFKDHDLKNLEESIGKRMSVCNKKNVSDYLAFVSASAYQDKEFRELVNLLTVNHTYFFRNEPHFNTLKNKILPEIIQKKLNSRENFEKKPKIRIWSAGCSTGEEPYSIAMTLLDLIEDIQDWDIEIYATDASTQALQKAKIGIYGKNSMRLVDQNHIKEYFVLDSSSNQSNRSGQLKYRIKDSIKRMVQFEYQNMVSDIFHQGYDLIFCRNVVIYFPLKTTINVMKKFHSSLKDDGYMFIGYSESLQYISDKFKMNNWENSIYYRKSSQKTDTLNEFSSPLHEKTESLIEKFSKAEWETLRKEEEKKYEFSPKVVEDLIVEIIKASRKKEYGKALLLIEKAVELDEKNINPVYLAAEIHSNRGEFTKARERLVSVLKLNNFYAPAYCLAGTIYMEEGDFDRAKENMKKALFLDKDFAMAYFNLAAVYRREGQAEEAIRGYRNTLRALSTNAPEDVVIYSGGFNSATIISLCKNNIERLKAQEWN